MTQGIEKQIGTLPAIETEAHFFEVGRQMLCANPMPGSQYPALEQRESGLDSVCVNIAHYIHAGTMIDGLMVFDPSPLHCKRVCGEIVSHNHVHIGTDVFADILCQCPGLHVLGMKQAKLTVALANANDNFFLRVALAARLSAYIGFVHFDFAVEHRFIGLRHSVPDAMTEIPCCLVAHSDGPLNLASGHSLFRFTEQVCSEEPFRQREMGIVEHRAGCNRKLVITILAVKKLLRSFKPDNGAFAAQALRAFGEAQAHQKFTALFFGSEQSVYIN